MIQSRSALATQGLLLALLGCAERPAATGSVTFRLASGVSSITDSVVVRLGRDALVIRRAELVIKDVQLAPSAAGECDPDEEEACAPLELGPVLITLPLRERAAALVTAPVPAATYIVFHFALYAPDAGRDSAFVAAHTDFLGRSVRVHGTFDRAGTRTDFVYTSSFTEEHETGLLPPLVVAAGDTANLTLRWDVATWFLNDAKTALIDPVSAMTAGPNRSRVHDNIRTSVTVFRDDNEDGLDDAGEARVSPWTAAPRDSVRFASVVATEPGRVPRCRRQVPQLTSDSIGPFRLDQSLAELRRECPGLMPGWATDPDGYAVPAVAARLGNVVVTALLTDTVPNARVRQVDIDDPGPRTARGIGVGSRLTDLQRAYGTPGASEGDCALRVWFEALPGLAFRMTLPARGSQDCGGLSEPPLSGDLRVAGVILVPR